MKRLIIYFAQGCAACEAALVILARWHPSEVVIERRNVSVCDWKLPDGGDVRLTPTYVLVSPQGQVLAMHANARKPTLSLSELDRFAKKEAEAA